MSDLDFILDVADLALIAYALRHTAESQDHSGINRDERARLMELADTLHDHEVELIPRKLGDPHMVAGRRVAAYAPRLKDRRRDEIAAQTK